MVWSFSLNVSAVNENIHDANVNDRIIWLPCMLKLDAYLLYNNFFLYNVWKLTAVFCKHKNQA